MKKETERWKAEKIETRKRSEQTLRLSNSKPVRAIFAERERKKKWITEK